MGNSGGWHGKGSRHERGYGATWQKLRVRILQRDCYLCQDCLKRGQLTEATDVDHIKPKFRGGTDEEDNLQSLCRPCHEAKTAEEAAIAQGRTMKPRLKFDAKGFPIW